MPSIETNRINGVNKVFVVLGAQWGDEGKGKVIDYLISRNKANVVARCQGGNNAGHTVMANGKNYVFHLLPSGMASAHCLNIIGNGVVVNLDALFKELEDNGIYQDVSDWKERLLISNKCHLVFDCHLQADAMQENELMDKKIGTTKRGIGPVYETKVHRNGIPIAYLIGDFDAFTKRYRSIVEHFRRFFPDMRLDEASELERLKNHAVTLKQLGIVRETIFALEDFQRQGKSILVEGANGAMLDIDFGTFPFVTSSNSTVGGVSTGLGLPPQAIGSVLGVTKAYTTRVGSGPFPTELLDPDGTPNAEGETLQRIGVEFGATSGRLRRCGWLDLFLLRYAKQINGFTELALTKVDVLDSFKKIKVCTAYYLKGILLKEPPTCIDDWGMIEVKYETFPGWNEQGTTKDKHSYDDLPLNCQAYIEYIEKFLDIPVVYIGVGESRESLIIR